MTAAGATSALATSALAASTLAASTLAATLHGAMDLRAEIAPLPPLAPGMVRIAFGAGGICGSDLAYFRNGRTGDFVVTSPLVLGHEVAGTVVAGATAALPAGTRVAINPSRWCGACPRCAEGRANLCEGVRFMGSASRTPHVAGGFAALFDARPAQCHPVPDHVPLEAAALAEPLAVALHAARRAAPVAGRRALVVGAGPIGLLIALALRLEGAASVAVADVAAAPLALAERMGAGGMGADAALDLSGEGGAGALREAGPFDIAVESSGTPAGLATALGAARRGGVVVQVGNLPAGDLPMPVNQVMARELDLRGSLRFDEGDYAGALRLIAQGRADVLALVTARLPLAEAPAAFRLALDRARSVKVLLTARGAPRPAAC